MDAYYGAALTAGKAADCEACLQLGVSMAEAGGVAPATIRAILDRDFAKCSKEALLGAELALATVARDGSGTTARAEILERWGAPGWYRSHMRSSARKRIPRSNTRSGTGTRACGCAWAARPSPWRIRSTRDR
jgi:hypothetical protein